MNNILKSRQSVTQVLVLLFCSVIGVSAQTTIKPDAPTDTNIDSYYSDLGVTFQEWPEAVPPGSNGNVYAYDGYFQIAPQSGAGIAINPYAGGVKAIFSTLQSTVSINVAPVGSFEGFGPDPMNDPELEAYDSGGTEIARSTYTIADLPSDGGAGGVQTLTVTSPSTDISYVTFDSNAVPYSDGEDAEWQDLTFGTGSANGDVPEPSTWALLLGGLGLLTWGHRTRRA